VNASAGLKRGVALGRTPGSVYGGPKGGKAEGCHAREDKGAKRGGDLEGQGWKTPAKVGRIAGGHQRKLPREVGAGIPHSEKKRPKWGGGQRGEDTQGGEGVVQKTTYKGETQRDGDFRRWGGTQVGKCSFEYAPHKLRGDKLNRGAGEPAVEDSEQLL